MEWTNVQDEIEKGHENYPVGEYVLLTTTMSKVGIEPDYLKRFREVPVSDMKTNKSMLKRLSMVMSNKGMHYPRMKEFRERKPLEVLHVFNVDIDPEVKKSKNWDLIKGSFNKIAGEEDLYYVTYYVVTHGEEEDERKRNMFVVAEGDAVLHTQESLARLENRKEGWLRKQKSRPERFIRKEQVRSGIQFKTLSGEMVMGEPARGVGEFRSDGLRWLTAYEIVSVQEEDDVVHVEVKERDSKQRAMVTVEHGIDYVQVSYPEE